jgi:hypothetical protein
MGLPGGWRLWFGRYLAGGNQREEKDNNPSGAQEAADSDQKNEGQRSCPEKADAFHEQAGNQ